MKKRKRHGYTNNPHKKAVTFQDLHDLVIKGANQIGLRQMTLLLANIFETNGLEIEKSSKLKIICEFLKSATADTCELNTKEFFTSNIPEYKDARFIYYHLLKKYGNVSYQMIGKHFEQIGMNKRKVVYSCKECEIRLAESTFEIPSDRLFKSNYKTVEHDLIQFLSKLSPQTPSQPDNER